MGEASERFREQQRQKVIDQLGEDLAEEFISVATDGGHTRPEDVALLMVAAYHRGIDDITRYKSSLHRPAPVQHVESGDDASLSGNDMIVTRNTSLERRVSRSWD